jgi:P-type E1-E2 ATPase
VSVSGPDTRVGRIFQSMEASLARRAPIVAFSDRVSRGFIALILALMPLVFFAGIGSGWEEALSRTLALALVTCPCAFALATPLTFAVSLGRCARAGILVKGGEVLERLSRARTVFLDKTGTLTEGRFSVLAWQGELDARQAAPMVVALESKSRHPIARALTRHFAQLVDAPVPEARELAERMGEGISARIDGALWRIGAAPEAAGPRLSGDPETRVALWRDERLMGVATLGDPVRDDAPAAIDDMRALGLAPRILSGDSSLAVGQVARRLGIAGDRDGRLAVGGASPERKKEAVESEPEAIMVGDGANDAVALAAAYVSVAVHGGLEASIRAADVYLSRPGLRQVPRLVTVSRETMKVVRRNFVVSLSYNVGAAVAAAMGWLNPLFAAILMPISAFAVFASSILGTRRLKAALMEFDT